MSERTQDVIERVLKTFVQAALAILIPSLIAYLNQIELPVAVCPAIAAGIAAVWNLLFPSTKQKELTTTVQEDHKEDK